MKQVAWHSMSETKKMYTDDTGGGGGIKSVETTRLTRTETRHGFLAHGYPLRMSLYGRQRKDSVWVPQ